VAACSAAFAAASTAARAADPATLRAVGGDQSNGKLTVDVVADGAADLGGYTFVLSWDPGALKLDDIDAGPLLSQTGRKPICQPAKQDGATRMDCVTLDPNASSGHPALTQVAGAAGSGSIAVLHFDVLRAGGNVQFHLSKVKLVDPYGDELPSRAQDSNVALGGSSGPRMALIMGLGGGVALLVLAGAGALVWRRRRSIDERDAYPLAAARSFDEPKS
jgi:hypothetical protein